jgi:hypothetical protein
MPKPASKPKSGENRYGALLEKIFLDRYKKGSKEVLFSRDDFAIAARSLKLDLPKNLGDITYAARYRNALPKSIVATQPDGHEWSIDGVGDARYAFRLGPVVRIAPNPNLATIKIPDATPEIVSTYALTDEQALLAIVRYNRLIDIFLGIATFSLQSHLRTKVKGIGQIEIDEVYVGVDRGGRHYAVPVQAKGKSDKLGSTQAKQDMAWCAEKFPHLICRAISAQFMEPNLVALFELTIEDGRVRIVDEAHYRLVPSEQIGPDDLAGYRARKR